MFQNFQPTPSRRYPVSVKALRTLCQRARSLEQMIYTWCDHRRSVLISKDFGGNVDKIVVSFFIRRRLLGSVEIELSTLLKKYPQATKIEVGQSPDPQLFNNRRDRLGLYMLKTEEAIDGVTAAPADAIGELIVSYAMSTYGFAEIKLVSPVGSTFSRFYELKLITINPDSKTGWTETFLVKKEDLHFLVELEAAFAKGLIH